MKPLPDQASGGRANPKGLPYLYVATDRDTAVAEVRPWVGAFVSVAQMALARRLVVTDFSKEKQRLIAYGAEPSAMERQSAVRRDMNAAFCKPVTPSDLVAEYGLRR
jgi:RES domain-containing protein